MVDPVTYRPEYNLGSKELAALELIASAQNPNLSIDQVQLLTLNGIKQVTDGEKIVLILLNTEDGMAMKKVLGRSGDWEKQFISKVESGLVELSIQQRQQMAFRDITSNLVYNPNFDTVDGLEPRTILCIPLITQSFVIGVVEVINYQEEPLSPGEEVSVSSLTSVLANTIYKNNLVQQLKVANADLEANRWELINSRNTLRALFDSIPSSMYIINKHYQLIAVNKSRAERTKIHPKHLIGKKCYAGLHKLEEPCPGCVVNETLISGTVTSRSNRVWGNNDQPTEWEISTYPIYDDNRQLNQAILLEQDVTEKRRLENNLAQSEKLAAVGQLAAGVAHEINNPLTAIIANAQLLQREPSLDADLKESVKLIELAGVRASQVVRNLLGFARKELFEFAPTDLNETIQSALALLQHELVSRQVKLALDLGKDLPLLFASKDHLQGVWINMLMNAMDALKPGQGEITIATRHVPNEFRVSFKDNGNGIPEEWIPRIFEPFYTTKAQGHGTGLGLSVCHRVVKQHGGYITVDSEVGVGTIFTVILPANPTRGGIVGQSKP
jgi:two-component system, NtrC family, sensor kinase